MSKTEFERISVKTLDNQFAYILREQFELSPREAEAIVAVANEIYDLKHYDPSKQAADDKIVRTVISRDAKHGPKLEELPKVQVVLTKRISKEDTDLYRRENKPSLRGIHILRMTNEAVEQGGVLRPTLSVWLLPPTITTLQKKIKKRIKMIKHPQKSRLGAKYRDFH